MDCIAHGRSILRCGRCLPKKFWPKGLKACRCGVLIDKTWTKCGDCVAFETRDWIDNGIAHRRTNHALIRQANA